MRHCPLFRPVYDVCFVHLIDLGAFCTTRRNNFVFRGLAPETPFDLFWKISNCKTNTPVLGDGHLFKHSEGVPGRAPRARRQWTGLASMGYRDLLPRADSSDFGLLEGQSSPKWETPCQIRPWTTVQNLTRLALFSPEKTVTVQTNKQTKTANYICTPCLSACVSYNWQIHIKSSR